MKIYNYILFSSLFIIIVACDNRHNNYTHGHEKDTIKNIYVYEEIFKSDLNTSIHSKDTFYQKVSPINLLKHYFYPTDSLLASKFNEENIEFLTIMNDSVNVYVFSLTEADFFIFEDEDIGTLGIIDYLHFTYHGIHLTETSLLTKKQVNTTSSNIKAFYDSIIEKNNKELRDLTIQVDSLP